MVFLDLCRHLKICYIILYLYRILNDLEPIRLSLEKVPGDVMEKSTNKLKTIKIIKILYNKK